MEYESPSSFYETYLSLEKGFGVTKEVYLENLLMRVWFDHLTEDERGILRKRVTQP